jgi:DNA-binding response OmpR family regulator
MTERSKQRLVLVVDDEPDLQTLIGQLLWDAGHEVEFAAAGLPALERIELGGLDLVVLDLLLPDIDGHVVLERLRRRAASPPVLVVSGRADYGSCAQALRQGAAGYLVKPFTVHDLLAACDTILESAGSRRVDRRSAPRQMVTGGVRVFGLDGEQLTLGQLVDLSPGGAQVRLGAPLQPRAGVRLALETQHGSAFDVESRIAWRGLAPKGFAHGLGFVNLTPEHEGWLRRYLDLNA